MFYRFIVQHKAVLLQKIRLNVVILCHQKRYFYLIFHPITEPMCIIVSYEAPSSLSFGTNLHCSWKRFSLTAVFKCVSQVLHTPFRLISFCEMSPEPIKFWQIPNTKNDIIETKMAARTTGNLFCCCSFSFSFDQGRVSYIHEIVFNINWLVKVMNIFVIVNLGILNYDRFTSKYRFSLVFFRFCVRACHRFPSFLPPFHSSVLKPNFDLIIW